MKRAAEAVVIDAEMARCMINIIGRPSWWLWSVGFGFSIFGFRTVYSFGRLLATYVLPL